jgi:hypothetical protein
VPLEGSLSLVTCNIFDVPIRVQIGLICCSEAAKPWEIDISANVSFFHVPTLSPVTSPVLGFFHHCIAAMPWKTVPLCKLFHVYVLASLSGGSGPVLRLFHHSITTISPETALKMKLSM